MSDMNEFARLLEDVVNAYFDCGEAPADEQYAALLASAWRAKKDLIQWVDDKLKTAEGVQADGEPTNPY